MKTIASPPKTDEWNDSLKGEFLWSSVNTNEALPDVMTPAVGRCGRSITLIPIR